MGYSSILIQLNLYILNNRKIPSLTTCIVLDLIGMASYLVPVLGETFDFIWAPISGIIFYFLFGMKKFGMMGGLFSLIEEISPGFDIIPTFTIAWVIRNRELKNSTLDLKEIV